MSDSRPVCQAHCTPCTPCTLQPPSSLLPMSVGLSRSQCVRHQSKFSSQFFLLFGCATFPASSCLLAPYLATSPFIPVVPQLQSSLVFSQLASFSFECDYPKAVGKLRFALIDGHLRRVTPRLAGCIFLSLLACTLLSLSLSLTLHLHCLQCPCPAATGGGQLLLLLLVLAPCSLFC